MRWLSDLSRPFGAPSPEERDKRTNTGEDGLPYSQFAIRYSLLTTHYSLLTTHSPYANPRAAPSTDTFPGPSAITPSAIAAQVM